MATIFGSQDVSVTFQKHLGRGSYGSVSLYEHVSLKERKLLQVAVKTTDEKHAEALFKEFEILSKFKGCKRIVQCYGDKVEEIPTCDCNFEYNLSMEYASLGSLRSLIEDYPEKKLEDDKMIRSFTRMLLQGLISIHRRGYVHCDLKPENILVFPRIHKKDGKSVMSMELKISDFGLAKKDGDSSWWSVRRPCVGTPLYMSPESYSHGETSTGLDLWSLGCVVLEMYTGKKPWWHTKFDVKDNLLKFQEPLIPTDLPCDIQLFLKTCFAPAPAQRRDALSLLIQYFFHEN